MVALTQSGSGSNYWLTALRVPSVVVFGPKSHLAQINDIGTLGPKDIKFRSIAVERMISPIFKLSVISVISRKMRVL